MTSRLLRAVVAGSVTIAMVALPAASAQADRIRDDQWHLRYLHVAEAHRISQGEGVTVAVIDTGVDPHPDLSNNLLLGAEVFSGGTGNGHTDTDGHGTSMAGLVAAHGRGSSGALGIAPKARILPIRDQARDTSSDSGTLASGIELAIRRGAQVISTSVASGPSPALRHAAEAAVAANVILIAAAGNTPYDFGITFPASLDGVVAVGAVDREGNHASISVTGNKMALVAPGTDIYSTGKGGRYSKGTGTSDSAAIVAGAAALVRSRYPELSATEVVHRLTATAVDKGPPGRDEEYGYGVLDLVAALTADVPPLATASPTAEAGPTATGSVAAPGPGTSGGSGATRLFGLGALLVVAVAVGLLLFLPRLRRARAGRPPTGGDRPGTAGGGHGVGE